MAVGDECWCGWEVHAKTVVASLVTEGRKEIGTFATMTDELLQLGDWLGSVGGRHGAIESTGGYWKPVFNLLEGLLTVILVNARHLKAVPGRKTDVRDWEWVADLLGHGRLQASVIPPREMRELRELIGYRQTVGKEHTAVAHRIQKLLESASIKLGQVASEVLGRSGRLMLRALAEGVPNAPQRAELAQGKLKSKKRE
ncbi:MAG: transposase [Acidobacteria bacterium]|nr:transposase [Acidobacteriota bacterium]